MKKWILSLLGIVLLLGIYTAYSILGPGTRVPKGKYIYVKTGATYSDLKKELEEKEVLKSAFWFDKTAQYLKLPQSVKAGRYEIVDGMSVLQLVRKLRNGQQSPINLVISRRIRLQDDLTRIIGDKFEFSKDDMQAFLTSNDSLRQFDLDTATFTMAIFPDTYQFFWNTTARKVFTRLWEESNKFWTEERLTKAREKGLSRKQVHIIGSIVDEESNYAPEKPTIASVYINRVNKGMRLQADPTVKFALRDFSLTRIRYKHLTVASPYNTYKNSGLPPGPICNVQKSTIDAVLDAPKTDYIYFVANSDFSGSHVFSTNDTDHLKYARLFQTALDSLELARQRKNGLTISDKKE